MASDMKVTHYELLDVPVTATNEEIKKAYRRCSRGAHPDRGGNAGLFRMIQMAYDTLADPVRRAEYDRAHLGIRTPRPQPKPESKTMKNTIVTLVCKDHIDLLVTAFMTFTHPDEAPKARARMGEKFGRGFIAQNLNSWNHCHPKDIRTDTSFRWAPVAEFVDAYWDHDVIPGHFMVQVIKAIEFYEDQSSEHPGWDDDDNGIRHMCRAVRKVSANGLSKYLDWPKDERPVEGGRLTWRGWNIAASHWTREHGFVEP